MSELQYGVEGLLGDWDADELRVDVQTAVDRLALATQYLANWYKATSDSSNKDVWWQKIDTLRRKVEDAYKLLTPWVGKSFPKRDAVDAYKAAAISWPGLWRDLSLSPDLIDVSLLSQTADFGETLFRTPGLLIPQIGNELGKIVGGTLGNFLRQTWPYLAVAGGLGLVYIFRGPLMRLASKVGS